MGSFRIIGGGELGGAPGWLLAAAVFLGLLSAGLAFWKRKDVFHPLFLFTGLYLFWMVVGFLVAAHTGSLSVPDHVRLIPGLILIGQLSFLAGYALPALSRRESLPPSGEEATYRVVVGNLYLLYLVGFAAAVAYFLLSWEVLMSGPIQKTRFEAVAGRGYLYHLMELCYFFCLAYAATKLFYRHPFTLLDCCLIVLGLAPIFVHLHRGPVIWLLFSGLAFFHYTRKRISPGPLLILAVAFFFLGAFLVNLRETGRVEGTPKRGGDEIKVHVYNLSRHLGNPDLGLPLGLRPFWMAFALLRPGPDPDFATWLRDQYGETNIPSVTLLGEGMLSFGVAGVAVEFLLVGFLMKQAYARFRNVPSLRNLIVYVIILMQSCSAITFGISKVLISTMYFLLLTWIVIPARSFASAGGPSRSVGDGKVALGNPVEQEA